MNDNPKSASIDDDHVVSVSVLMPVYNGALHVAEAIRSVLDQNLHDMEIIVLDDGSKDASWEVIQGFSDPRIRAVRHENRGLAATLNRGLELARGRYIARMDHDDLALPGRMVKQRAYLDAHPEVALLGTWADIQLDGRPTGRFHRHVQSNEAIRLFLMFDNPFVHASIMARADVLRSLGGYCEDRARDPEDYELWSRVARRHAVANLPEVLTIYRETPNSLSRSTENPLLNKVARLSAENLHGVLAPDYAAGDCESLARLYHNLERPQAMKKAKAVGMAKLLVQRVGGPPQHWSEEFAREAQRVQSHIEYRFLRRRIPAPLLGPARWLRNTLLRRKGAS